MSLPKKLSEKPKVFEHLYGLVEDGTITGDIILSDDIIAAIKKTGADLSPRNPANFLKDIIRNNNANVVWPQSLKDKGITARQRYGDRRVFQFVKYKEGQTEPFPNRFVPDTNTPEYLVQSASVPFAARQLGRKEESWVTQIAVYLRLIETQLAVFSPLRALVRDVTHLQMGMKTQPEIDAVYVASFGKTESLKSETNLHLSVTCEAKQDKERILEDQIKEQVAESMKRTRTIKTPKIGGVKPMAVKVVRHKFNGCDEEERGIYVVEFAHIMREEFETSWLPADKNDDRLYAMPLEKVSDAVYRIMPPVRGVNA